MLRRCCGACVPCCVIHPALCVRPCARDATAASILGGYPNLFFQCLEVAVSDALPLTPASLASIVRASFSAATTPLNLFLWWATPANVAATCAQYIDGSNKPLAPNSTFQLDPFNSSAAASGAGCAAWPCAATAPFGGALGVVKELASAPRIAFLPGGCTGAACVAPFPGGPFAGCPGGVLTMPTAASGWSSSPCQFLTNGKPASAFSPNASLPTTVGNAPAAPPPASPPPPPLPPPPFPISQKGIVAWLAVLTAVFSCFFIVIAAQALSRSIAASAAASAEDKYADAGRSPAAAKHLPAPTFIGAEQT